MKKTNTNHHIIVLALTFSLIAFKAGLGAEELQVFDLRYQWASEPDGPWEDLPPEAVYMSGGGAMRVASDGPRAFFRLQINEAGTQAALPMRRFNELPSMAQKVALEHIAGVAEEAEDDPDFANWRNVTISPFVVPLQTGWEEGQEAKYAELKVIALDDPESDPSGDFLPDDSTIRPERNRGYIVVSLDRSDFPVLQWASEGPTPSEELLRLASARSGARIARIARFGSTLLVAEDEQGRPVANLGTEPFKILPQALEALSEPIIWEYDTEDETRQEDPPRMESLFRNYESYREMKDDLRTNPFQQAVRTHRQRLAGYVWDVIEGIEPEILTVQVGETRVFHEGTTFNRIEAQWEEPDDIPLARILALPRSGGLQITGTIPGSTLLSLYGPDGISQYALWVTEEGSPRLQDVRPMNVAVKISKKTWTAGAGWSDQKRYHQTSHSNWCKKVGCGPVALAMLFGWWDHKGVPSAFYRQSGTASQKRLSLRTADAPETADNSLIHPSYYHYLHDLCDVICFGIFSNSGATWPSDLIEGVHGYLAPLGPWWFVLGPLGVTSPLIGYNTSWAWDAFGNDWHTSGSRVAKGIKNGRPGIVGLGVLWHYALAYKYRRQEVYVEINGQKAYTIGITREFACNEGWGKKNGAWYSAYDVFLGLRANLSQKTLPPAP
jgi:hypothetical protein